MAKEKQIRIELTAEVAGAVVEALERKSQEIEAKIAELRSLIDQGGGAIPTGSTGHARKKRSFSAAAKKKMAKAQRKRWAEKKMASSGT